MATLITKNSSTASSVPTNAQLVQGELAVNVTDKRLFTENASGIVVELGTNPSSLTLPNGVANAVCYLNGSKVLTTGSALTFDGATLSVTSGGSTPALRVFGASTSQGQIQFGSVNGYLIQGGSDYLGLNFNTNSATRYTITDTGVSVWSVAGSEAMRLTSTGLGIGTSSPAEKLHVVGAARIVTTGSPSGVAALQISANATNARTIRMTNTVTGGRTYDIINGAGGVAGDLGIFDDTAGVYRLILDSSGNLGLGVTPSAWNYGGRVLELNNNGAIATAGPNTSYFANTFFDGSNFVRKVLGTATYYSQQSGIHLWGIAGSGAAGSTISFTQAMTLDASGNFLLNTTSLSTYKANFNGTVGVYGGNGVFFQNGSNNAASAIYNDGATGVSQLQFNAGGSERARIDSSGSLLVGTTSSAYASGERVSISAASTKNGLGIAVSGSGAKGIGIYNGNSSGATSGTMVEFQNASSVAVGSITSTGTATSYNVTSDQRLKENIADADSASALIDSLQVRKYDWKSDGTHQRYGFVAQELVTVAPEAVHQPADPEAMMAVDYSKLVPMLVKEIQSLRKRLAALESK